MKEIRRIGPGIGLDRDLRPPLYAMGERAGSPQDHGIFAVPTEDVLLVRVPLPLANARQRLAALPFAVEDLISEPLASVHLALGPELGPRDYLAAVVRRTLMDEWVQRARQEGHEASPLVPDALLLPTPAEGHWAVALTGDRLLIRPADGTGFVLDTALFEQAWLAAGKPALISYGEPLPNELAAVPGERPTASTLKLPIDLRQGIYAAKAAKTPAIVKWAAGLLAAGIALHTLVAALDLNALQSIAEAREMRAQTLLHTIAPGTPVGGDVVAALNRLAPDGRQRNGSRFLGLMAVAATAMQPFKGKVEVQALSFSGPEGTLAMTVGGPDLETLQALESAFRAASLNPVSGPATTDRGGAEFRITVRAT